MSGIDKKNKQRKEHPILWWVGWIVLTIAAFFISCIFWTKIIAKHVGPMDQSGVPILWVSAVFGSWMVLLVPLIIVMYNKVDRSYENARMNREAATQKKLASELNVPTLFVPREKRLLPATIKKELGRKPKTLKNGHLVRLTFPSGQILDNAFVCDGEEVVGVYGRKDFPFDVRTARSFEVLDPAETQPVEYHEWLRLDES